MVQRRTSLIDPPIEDLLDKVDSKFTLVSLSAKRARQINSYYNQLGEGMGVVVPPQVTSISGKPLTIAFEEVAAHKTTYHHPDPSEETEDSADALADTGSGAELSAQPPASDPTDAVGVSASGADASDSPSSGEEPT